MGKLNQTKMSFDATALYEATGGNKMFFNQMMDTFIENTESTYKGLKNGLENKNWNLIGEEAHKAMPSFKYFDLNDFVAEFKTLEDFTLRDPQYHRVPDTVKNLLEDLEILIDNARSARFPAHEI